MTIEGPQKKETIPRDRLIQVSIYAILFVCGSLANAVALASKVATVSYVDQKFEEVKSYSDTRVELALRELMGDVKVLRSRQDIMLDLMKERRR